MRLEFDNRLTFSAVLNLQDRHGLSFEPVGESGWKAKPAKGKNDALVLDLSRVAFADLDALAALTVVAHAIAPPSSEIQVDLPWAADTKRFIRTSGFLEVLHDAPDGKRRILSDEPIVARRKQRIFTLRWMSIPWEEDLETYLRVVFQVPSGANSSRPMNSRTASSLARAICRELIENAERHSRGSTALLGAIAPRPITAISGESLLPLESSFHQRHIGQSSSVTQIVVVDGGAGILRTLRPSCRDRADRDVVAYAFDRWSSSVDESTARGTRGLYRVARLAKRYEGLATLTSDKYSAAQVSDHAIRVSSEQMEARSLAFPGTILRIRLPITLQPQRSDEYVDGELPRISLVSLRWEDAGDLEVLRRAMGRHWSPNRLVLVQPTGTAPNHAETCRILLKMATVSHPNILCVHDADHSVDDIIEAANAVNQHLERVAGGDLHSAFLEGYEPVMVTDRTFTVAQWVGTTHDVAGILDGSHTSDDQDTLRYIQGLSLLVQRPDGRWARRLTTNALVGGIQRSLDEALNENTDYPPVGRSYITPALRIVASWTDIRRLLQDERVRRLGPQFICYKLMRVVPNILEARPCLIYESLIDDDFATRVAESLTGSYPLNTDFQRVGLHDLDSAQPLVIEDRPVVLLVAALSSEQMARRIAGYAIRQEFDIAAIVAILDSREKEHEITIWGRSIPVASVVRRPENGSSELRPIFLNRAGRREGALPASKLLVRTSEIIRSLWKANALQLGHFAVESDRHMTFAVDGDMALADDRIRIRLVKSLCAIAGESIAIGSILLIFGAEEMRSDTPALRMAHLVGDEMGASTMAFDSLERRSVRRQVADAAVVLVAWGSITGSSLIDQLNRLLEFSPRSVTIPVVFSQLDPRMEAHFRSISMVRGIPVRFDFVARLPVAAYDHENCPVCQQIVRNQHKSIGRSKEARLERERLAVSLWHPDALDGHADAISRQYGGDAREIVGAALSWRSALSTADRSTSAAYDLSRRLRKMLTRRTSLLGLSTLLAFEPVWLGRSPLSEMNCRRTIVNQMLEFLVPDSLLPEPTPDVVRALIGLRLVSKVDLARNAGLIVQALTTDHRALDVLHHLLDSLLKRKYILKTELPSELSVSLVNAPTVVPPESREDWEELLLAADEVRRSSQPLTSGEPPVLAWTRLEDSAYAFNSHRVGDSFEQALDLNRSTNDRATKWGSVERWMRLEIQPRVERFRSRILRTNALSEFHGQFARVLPPNGLDGSVVRIREKLNAMARDPAVSLAESSREVREISEDIRLLFHVTTTEDLSIFRQGLTELYVNIASLVEVLQEACDEHNLQLSVDSEVPKLGVVFWPQMFCSTLVSNVVQNASHAACAGTRVLKVSWLKFPEYLELHLESNTIYGGERDVGRPGPGGLEEVRKAAPEDVRVRTEKDAGRFVVIVTDPLV